MSERHEWNHVPADLPLGTNPLWHWPPAPRAVLAWYWSSWFPLTINLAIVALAVAAFHWASPTLETATRPGLWIITIWARNLVIVALLAQGLHWLFHSRQLQGEAHKYDPRPFPRAGRAFTFANQYWDNVFWALTSGVAVWSGYEALLWWAMANGYAPVWYWSDGWIWFIAIFFLVPIWESFYFYWIHRLLHTNLFYRFHALHHRNTDIGPWSGLSMHPVEHLIFLSAGLIFLVVPAAPVHVLFLMQYLTLTAATTHTGFAGLLLKDKNRLKLGTFHHQMHHRYFE